MNWEGTKIKEFTKTKKLSLKKLAEIIGVSRQTVNDWIGGQVPKGNHLIALCKLLDVNPDELFSKSAETNISVPMHRTRKTAKTNKKMQKASLDLAKEYKNLFKSYSEATIIPTIKVSDRGEESAKKIANDLRTKYNLDENPVNYDKSFKMINDLGITVIFRYFPKQIKGYAFYTEIFDQKVIFVNNDTNIIDLIFPLLHETIHAIRDETGNDNIYEDEEEKFCDLVANYLQFPENYTKMVYNFIEGLDNGTQINILKNFARKNKHSLFEIVNSIRLTHQEFDLDVGGADTNLKKEFPTVGDILFKKNDAGEFVNTLAKLSRKFINILTDQIDTLSVRKLGELLNIENILDAEQVKAELMKLKKYSED